MNFLGRLQGLRGLFGPFLPWKKGHKNNDNLWGLFATKKG